MEPDESLHLCALVLCRGRQIAIDIAQGLAYLHDASIVHLDLKSPNILLTDTWEAKIADVGMARV